MPSFLKSLHSSNHQTCLLDTDLHVSTNTYGSYMDLGTEGKNFIANSKSVHILAFKCLSAML